MRRTLVWMVLAAIAWPAVGCGDDDGGAGSDQQVDRLVSALKAAEGASMRGSLLMRADTAREGRFRMSGTYEADGDRGRMRVRYVQDGAVIGMEMLLHEDVAWMRSPQLYELLPPGKRWIRTTDPELLGPTATPEMLGGILEAAGEVETLGRERMLGVETTHLRGTVDLREFAEKADAPGAAKFLRTLGDASAPLPIDIWTGPDGRPVRYHVEVELPRPGGGRPQFAAIDFEVHEYDVPVDTDPPPEAQVTDDSVLE